MSDTVDAEKIPPWINQSKLLRVPLAYFTKNKETYFSGSDPFGTCWFEMKAKKKKKKKKNWNEINSGDRSEKGVRRVDQDWRYKYECGPHRDNRWKWEYMKSLRPGIKRFKNSACGYILQAREVSGKQKKPSGIYKENTKHHHRGEKRPKVKKDALEKKKRRKKRKMLWWGTDAMKLSE